MSFRSRVYHTTKIGKGKRIVSSVSTSDYFLWEIIKLICKACFYIMFFWLIIPIKLIFRKK